MSQVAICEIESRIKTFEAAKAEKERKEADEKQAEEASKNYQEEVYRLAKDIKIQRDFNTINLDFNEITFERCEYVD